MKVVQLTGLRRLEICDLPKPELNRPDAVLLRIDRVGVCGSDVHYYANGRIGDQVVESYPFALGHECAGVVVEIGEGVSNVEPGQRVAVEPGITCGGCAPCREGRENICPNVKFLGTPPVQGALRERVLTTDRNVEPIPDSVSFEAAALCEPLGVGNVVDQAEHRLADGRPEHRLQ